MEAKTVSQAIEAKKNLRIDIESLIRAYEREYFGVEVKCVHVSRVRVCGEPHSVFRVELETAIH
jgi:hypothetical protein